MDTAIPFTASGNVYTTRCLDYVILYGSACVTQVFDIANIQ